jgi:hypothetical protein
MTIFQRIDLELLRLTNKQEYDAKMREEKNKNKSEAFEAQASLPSNYESNDYFDLLNQNNNIEYNQESFQKRKDRRMARDSPEQYCADRCVSTGYCDVYEDMFDMSSEEVIKFCKECVLSQEEEPCDVPDKIMLVSHHIEDGNKVGHTVPNAGPLLP